MAANVPVLVALSGKAGSGKSAISNILCDDEFAFIRVKFSTPLKDMLRSLLFSVGVPDAEVERYIEGDLKEESSKILGGKSPRYLMLTLGTEWGRDMVHHDFWVQMWERRVRHLMSLGHSVVVDDLRFANEEFVIRQLDGVIINVGRGEHKSVSHVSESYSPNADYTVDNNGALEDSMRQVVDSLNL